MTAQGNDLCAQIEWGWKAKLETDGRNESGIRGSVKIFGSPRSPLEEACGWVIGDEFSYYCTTRLKLTFSVIAVPLLGWNVAVTVSGYVPAAVPGGSTSAPLPPRHDEIVTIVDSIHRQKSRHKRRVRLQFHTGRNHRLVIQEKILKSEEQ
jgi:hypothetical protein